ncbi:MAG: hypothetical protein AAFX06_26055 [Planctomycetota bacterium]
MTRSFDAPKATSTSQRFTMQGIRRLGGSLVVVVWLAVTGVCVASLTAAHWITLPHPPVGDTLKAVVAEDERHDQLRAFHFLYRDCPCSRRVLDDVLDRPSVEGVIERVVLISVSAHDDAETINFPEDFEVDRCTPPELLSRYGVESAPLLVVVRNDGEIVYSGGYTTRKQGPEIRDEEILTALARSESVESLPVYGCAVSEELQQLVDPLRLKYSAWGGRE